MEAPLADVLITMQKKQHEAVLDSVRLFIVFHSITKHNNCQLVL